MKAIKKNYILYLIMLVLFTGMTYVSLHEGERFESLASTKVVPVSVESDFVAFQHVLTGNLNSPFAVLLLQIIVVLFAIRIFSFLFKYIGQPGVIGEIVAGIVLGPSLLGHFFPEFFGFLFRTESLTNLHLISQIGLILFMFVIGMEVDFRMLRTKISETLFISHAGIFVPFLLGILSSFWVYEKYASQQTDFLPFALFIGISMSITAFPVLARIIQERNLTKTPVGVLAIASAANDDVTAWCLLAIVIAIAKAGTFSSALYAVAFTILYIVVMFTVVRPLLRKIGDLYTNKEVINKSFVGLIFLILIISSTLTEVIGIHALFGAFIAGVVMPASFGFRKVMMEKVEDVSLVFFLPLFFAFTGLRTEIGLINTPELLGVLVLLLSVAVAGKFGGCTLASRLAGESWKDSLILGTLMNTRGLMELVALNIGYEMGVLPPSIFVILVIMALVTTFMTTPMLALVEKIFEVKKVVQSLKKKLILCFGRAESGKELLLVYDLLYGATLQQKEVIAAHYTMGTDLNLLNAQQYEKDSFRLVRRQANKLRIDIDCRYKVTEKVAQEMIQLVKNENPALLLLGSGNNYMSDGRPSVLTLLGLFRDKTDDIRDQVTCDVGVFVNHKFNAGKLAMAFDGLKDAFLLPYLEMLLSNNSGTIRLFIFQEGDGLSKGLNDLLDRYPKRIILLSIHKASQITYDMKDGLLILSHALCEKIATERSTYEALPSLLVMSSGQPQKV